MRTHPAPTTPAAPLASTPWRVPGWRWRDVAPHLICGVAVGLVELATWWVMDVAAAVAVLGAVGLLAGVCTIPTLLVASMALPAGARPPQGPAIACIKGVARR